MHVIPLVSNDCIRHKPVSLRRSLSDLDQQPGEQDVDQACALPAHPHSDVVRSHTGIVAPLNRQQHLHTKKMLTAYYYPHVLRINRYTGATSVRSYTSL